MIRYCVIVLWYYKLLNTANLTAVNYTLYVNLLTPMHFKIYHCIFNIEEVVYDACAYLFLVLPSSPFTTTLVH